MWKMHIYWNKKGEYEKNPTDKEIEEEVDYFLEHLDELAAKQQAERKAYFENPANAERIARTRQRLAIAEELYKATHEGRRGKKWTSLRKFLERRK